MKFLFFYFTIFFPVCLVGSCLIALLRKTTRCQRRRWSTTCVRHARGLNTCTRTASCISTSRFVVLTDWLFHSLKMEGSLWTFKLCQRKQGESATVTLEWKTWLLKKNATVTLEWKTWLLKENATVTLEWKTWLLKKNATVTSDWKMLQLTQMGKIILLP